MPLEEVVLCSTAPSTSASGPGTISLHNIQTGTTLATFKQTSTNSHNTAVVQTKDGQGGFMLAAQADKSIMNVYNFQKDQMALKIVLPEKLSCIAVDSKGRYCAGGTSQGRIYLWEIPSGIMFNAWDAHYRQVNVLRFTVDGQALVSGSEDSGVSVWSMSSLLDNASQNDLVSPYTSLSDHTLPVTDIICGIGVFPFCRILTASVDHSVKLWDLSSRTLLTTFQFPRPITTIAWDVTERVFFAASDDGSIHQVNLFRQRRDKFGREAVGGAGSTDIVRVDDEDERATKRRLITVGGPVSSLAISLFSSLLLAGTTTGTIQVFDIASHQLLRSITTHKGFSITYISTMLKPPDLVGHISLNLNVGGATDPRDTIPVRPVVAFQRMRDPKTREAHEVAMMLPIPPSVCPGFQTTPRSNVRVQKPPTSFFSYLMDELVRDQATFVQPSGSQSEPSGISLQTRVGELEAEVTKLREQLVKAKAINDTMWETVVHKVIVGGQNKDRSKEDDRMQTDSEEDEGRSHKKSRT